MFKLQEKHKGNIGQTPLSRATFNLFQFMQMHFMHFEGKQPCSGAQEWQLYGLGIQTHKLLISSLTPYPISYHISHLLLGLD